MILYSEHTSTPLSVQKLTWQLAFPTDVMHVSMVNPCGFPYLWVPVPSHLPRNLASIFFISYTVNLDFS